MSAWYNPKLEPVDDELWEILKDHEGCYNDYQVISKKENGPFLYNKQAMNKLLVKGYVEIFQN